MSYYSNQQPPVGVPPPQGQSPPDDLPTVSVTLLCHCSLRLLRRANRRPQAVVAFGSGPGAVCGSDRLICGCLYESDSFWLRWNRLSSGGVPEGCVPACGISGSAGVSSCRLPASAGLSPSLCFSVWPAPTTAATTTEQWILRRMVRFDLSLFDQ